MIEKADYYDQIEADNLNTLIGGNDSILDQAEESAKSQVKEYLNTRYDMDYELAQTGATRHPYLLTILKSIVLYTIWKRMPQHKIPQVRRDDYADAIIYLERVADGKQSSTLRKRTETDSDGETVTKTRWKLSSQNPRSH